MSQADALITLDHALVQPDVEYNGKFIIIVLLIAWHHH